VEFYTDPFEPYGTRDGKPKISLLGAPFRFVLTNIAPGWHRWAARAYDKSGNVTQSEVEFRVRQDNDDFANRVTLQSPEDSVKLNLSGMSLETGERLFTPTNIDTSAWFTWTSPGNGFFRAEWSQNYWPGSSAKITAFHGSALDNLVEIAGTNTQPFSSLLIPVNTGEIIELSVGSPGRLDNAGLDGNLAVHFFPAVPNDSFSTRAPLPQGTSFQISAHNVGAITDPNAISPLPTGPAVWWKWTVPSTGLARIALPYAVQQSFLSAYRGSSLATLQHLATVWSGVQQSFPVIAGEEIQIAAYTQEPNTGSFTFTLELLSVGPNSIFVNRPHFTGSSISSPLPIPGAVEAGAPADIQPYATWWEWTAAADGDVAIFAGYPPNKVNAFIGNSLAALTLAPGTNTLWGGLILKAQKGHDLSNRGEFTRSSPIPELWHR
jgi:hypothetical protein